MTTVARVIPLSAAARGATAARDSAASRDASSRDESHLVALDSSIVVRIFPDQNASRSERASGAAGGRQASAGAATALHTSTHGVKEGTDRKSGRAKTQKRRYN